jgi:hypothetical protein
MESTIERIRRVRHEISEECDHDPKKLVAYFRKLQQSHPDKLIISRITTKTLRN